ncbi:MAG: mercury methylation corrinoid protein HgcA [Syntrophorhabdaceae bacterium]|nr:mercury methylation corrinoid protein HgcA [Syntrophorhabdaceae bacterium]
MGENDKNPSPPHYIVGWHKTLSGVFPVVDTKLTLRDKLFSFLVRLGIKRMGYMVNPGVYAVGKPGGDSPILVTANYKLSFDSLRKHLGALDAWILVLDTKGINVWCAAGKGTFGTEELINKLRAFNIPFLVRHRHLILPQLSASGIAAHEVKRSTGFNVIYGPIRASDIPYFLKNGCKATKEMRRVTFTFMERLVLIPIELIQSWKIVLFALLFQVLLSFPSPDTTFLSLVKNTLPYINAALSGAVLTPLFLPFIPGRSFAFKGGLTGFFTTLFFCLLLDLKGAVLLTHLFLAPSISSYLALNFTGATPFTSPSGVKKEMKFSIPLIIILSVSGIFLSIYNLWRGI